MLGQLPEISKLANVFRAPTTQLTLAFRMTYALLAQMSMYYYQTCAKLSKYYYGTTAALAKNICSPHISANSA